MGVEIERKFLVLEGWREHAGPAVPHRDGYLVAAPERVVRVRQRGGEAFLAIKGPTEGHSRLEFEYPIPAADAAEMLARVACLPVVEKDRHIVMHAGRRWEVDVYHGANQGLVVAEVELEAEDAPLDLPAWAGTEVSHDPRYRNARLAREPYRDWPARDK